MTEQISEPQAGEYWHHQENNEHLRRRVRNEELVIRDSSGVFLRGCKVVFLYASLFLLYQFNQVYDWYHLEHHAQSTVGVVTRYDRLEDEDGDLIGTGRFLPIRLMARPIRTPSGLASVIVPLTRVRSLR